MCDQQGGNSLKIGNREIGSGAPLFIVAEAGSTSKGSLEIAKKLIDAAVDASCDAIKFIMSNPEELIADFTLQYEDKSLVQVILSYWVPDEDWRKVAAYCKERGIIFYVSVGTIDYIPLAEELEVPCYKIGGWDTTNKYLIEAVLETGKPIQFDIGAVNSSEVVALVEQIIETKGRQWFQRNVIFVYESHSPNASELNLKTIPYLKDRYDIAVGYSADWADWDPDGLAVSLGAVLIEKRIKLNNDDPGGHHQTKAIEAKKFKEYVYWLQSASYEFSPRFPRLEMLGDYGLFPSMADVSQRELWFVSLVFNRDVKAGEVITREMLAAKRPGNGLSPYLDYLFIGKRASRDAKNNEQLTYDSVTS